MDKELVITRVFDAPRERVWRAWAEPEYLIKWWGPKDFTCPHAQCDLKVGGRFLFCMRSPKGEDTWGTGVYREVEPHKRLVYTDSFADEEGNVVPASDYGLSSDFPMETEVEVDFDDFEGKTKMTLRHHDLPAGEMQDQTSAGWHEMFDKLADSLG